MARTLSIILGLSAALIAGSPVSATQAPRVPVTGKATIIGRVLHPDTAAPLAQVRVALWCSGRECLATLRETFTDADGTFSFPSLPAGTYEVGAVRRGWLPTRYGQTGPNRSATPIVLSDGEIRTGIVIQLLKGAAVDGRVTADDGQPLAGATVQLYRMRFTSAGQALDPVRSTATDDDGRYRLFEVASGEYVLKVTPAEAEIRTDVGVQPLPRTGYTAVWFPGVHSSAG